ncbi:MAG: YbdK family carboxylate-amine ligase [Gaiellaceae bacterium]
MIEQNFGRALTLGVEEELMILDPATHAQRPESERFVAAVFPERGTVKQELFLSVIELTTDVCESPDDAAQLVVELRRQAIEAAHGMNLDLAGAGSHPFDDPTEQRIAPGQHYEKFVAYAGPTARRQGVSGLHVHVGMPDSETCLRVLETILPWLPLVLALSANSPWFEGRRTELMSTRAEILGLLPRRGAPPAFASWAEWEALVDRLTRTGVIDNYNAIHWDIRPHPHYGTLEVRAPDQPTAVDRTKRFVSLIHGLCTWALEAAPREPMSRVVYDQNRWAASRFGPRAQLIHPTDDRLASVPDLYDEVVGLIGFDPALDPQTCEADAQLDEKTPQEVAADLVVRTLA